MSGNGTEKQRSKDGQPNLTAEVVFAMWIKEGGIELAAERAAGLHAMVKETIEANRARVEAERAELKAKSEAMESRFSALGFPGGPPLDEAEQKSAQRKGIAKDRPTPPADDETLRKALVQRILSVQRDHPKHPAATRGLARWSGATSERIMEVLKTATEVSVTGEQRWVAAAQRT
jgi:hypothetical protein